MHGATSSTDTLIARIERLERELDHERHATKRMRCAGVLACLVAAGAGLIAAAPSARAYAEDVIRARRIELVDGDNKVVGLLSTAADGGQLDLWTYNGTNAARLTATNKGGDLSIWNTRGSPAIGMFATDSGGRLETYDSSGRPAVRLANSADGSLLNLFNHAGKAVVVAKATDAGGGMGVCDALGRPLADLIAGSDGGMVSVAQRDGARVAYLNNGPRGGELRLMDSAGSLALAAGADADGGSFSTYSADKKPMVSIGPSNVGGGQLVVHNRAGIAAVLAASTNEGGGGQIMTMNTKGEPVVVSQGGDEGGRLGLLLAGKRLVFLEANLGGGRIEVGDNQGISEVAMGLDPSTKTGVVSVRGDKGQEAARLGSDERGSGALTVYNKDGTEKKVTSVK